jgi:hypothetical protein
MNVLPPDQSLDSSETFENQQFPQNYPLTISNGKELISQNIQDSSN